MFQGTNWTTTKGKKKKKKKKKETEMLNFYRITNFYFTSLVREGLGKKHN